MAAESALPIALLDWCGAIRLGHRRQGRLPTIHAMINIGTEGVLIRDGASGAAGVVGVRIRLARHEPADCPVVYRS